MFQSIYSLHDHPSIVRRRRYGVIEVAAGFMVALHFRPWPKWVSRVEAKWLGGWQHDRQRQDHCLLYYNQPLGHSNFLALKYVVTTRGTSYRTFRQALVTLDEVARIKGTDAIVAEVTNDRLSDRFLRRQGWQRHLHPSSRRHYIKRFYGSYGRPSATGQQRDRSTFDNTSQII